MFGLFVCLFDCLFVCWVVCLGFYFPLKNCLLIWIRHHYRWRALNFELCSALLVINKWGFCIVQHLLWQGHPFIMVYSEDPWHSPLLPSVFGSGAFTFCFYDLGLSRLGFELSTFCMRGERSDWLRYCGCGFCP